MSEASRWFRIFRSRTTVELTLFFSPLSSVLFSFYPFNLQTCHCHYGSPVSIYHDLAR